MTAKAGLLTLKDGWNSDLQLSKAKDAEGPAITVEICCGLEDNGKAYVRPTRY